MSAGRAQPPWASELRKWRRRSRSALYGQCIIAAGLFVQRWPELRIVHGFGSSAPLPRVLAILDGAPIEHGVLVSMHVWLIDSDGIVIDPSAGQYGSEPHRWPLRAGLTWDLTPMYRHWRPCCSVLRPKGVEELGLTCCGKTRREYFLSIIEAAP